MTWSGNPTTFIGGTVYTATITLTPKAGYSLTGVSADSFTVAGATATNGQGSGVITAVFPATAFLVITPQTLSGLVAPVTGVAPVTTVTETGQFTGTVTWSGNPTTFIGGTVYIATVTLSPKAGYTLTGVAANSFAVAGAASVNNANSGIVEVTFPATIAEVDPQIFSSNAIYSMPGDTKVASYPMPVLRWNGWTYWAFSYIDNRNSYNICAYDEFGTLRWSVERAGARYLNLISIAPGAQTVTFVGQDSYSVTMTYAELAPTSLVGIDPINGSTVVGSTLTAGLTAPSAAQVSYAWQRCDTLTGRYIDIAGASSNSYVLAPEDLGKYIRVVVKGTGSFRGMVISTAVGPVISP